jgi:hypothetical protein
LKSHWRSFGAVCIELISYHPGEAAFQNTGESSVPFGLNRFRSIPEKPRFSNFITGNCRMTTINPIDRDALRAHVRAAKPFPNFCIDNFLDPTFAKEVIEDYPSFERMRQAGREFKAVNERGKIQLTDSSKFAPAVARLNEALAAPEFLSLLSYVTDIPNMLADPELDGGGIHQTGARGHLDVHVDFNYIENRQLHRRLNLLIYLNEGWKPEWGGEIELWDQDVKVCHHRLSPIFNRCVVFETSEISFHGVTAVKCPPNVVRRSFAVYYYTREAPAHWHGESHSTIFRARPNERLKGLVMMPAERLSRWMRGSLRSAKRKLLG